MMRRPELPAGFQYIPGFLSPGEAKSLFTVLWRELCWKSHEITLFGKKVKQPRLSAWCSDPGINYQYSGLNLSPTPWHPGLDLLRGQIEKFVDCRFNSVLVNAYRHGQDSMGWHSDDERELGSDPVIASVSLGTERRFLIRPQGGGISSGIDLEHGGLLLMNGNSQRNWQHCVPKTRKQKELRLNLTFRLVHTSSSS